MKTDKQIEEAAEKLFTTIKGSWATPHHPFFIGAKWSQDELKKTLSKLLDEWDENDAEAGDIKEDIEYLINKL
jgi:hypothetical protein